MSLVRPLTRPLTRSITPGLVRSYDDFHPDDFGSLRMVQWDPRSGLTIPGKVSGWADSVGGLNPVEATDANRPTYAATGFRGRPAVDFAGVSAKLTLLAPGLDPLPAGAEGFDVLVLARQDALPADANTRCLISFGTTAATGRFSLTSVVVGGTVRRIAAIVGTGASSLNARNDLVDAVGDLAIHVRVEPDGVTVGVNGQYQAKVAGVPAIGADKLTLGCITNVTAANFWDGAIAFCQIDQLLPAPALAKAQRWLLQELAA
jgi:hypothetical protein